MYLIIVSLKLQSYKKALLLVFINILPFSIGKNLIETTLISPNEIFGYSLFQIQYFFPLVLADLFLVLIYQWHFSQKIRKKNPTLKIDRAVKFASFFYLLFLFLTLLKSTESNFPFLLFTASLQILKLFFIFLLGVLYSKEKNIKTVLFQGILASSFFQSILVIFEQIKGGNIGRYIENTLPGMKNATTVSEASDVLRANGTFNEANVAASFLLMGLAFLLPQIIKSLKEKKFQKWQISEKVVLAVSFLSLIAIVFTGSRSLYFLTALFLIFLGLKERIFQQLLGVMQKNIFLKIFLFLSLILILPYLLLRIGTLKNVLTPTGSISYRTELNQAILGFSDKNLLGIGLNLTPYYLAKSYKTATNQFTIFDPAPAHNIFVQLLAETGVLATIMLMSFFYIGLRNAYLKKDQRFFYFILIYLLAAQFHPIFTTHLELSSFFFLFLGFSFYADQIS